jgi:tetratricopeptide (TPR) repeat protein
MKRIILVTLFIIAAGLMFGSALYAEQIGTIHHIDGKAKLYPDGTPTNWVWAEGNMPLDSRAVLQVGPNSTAYIVLEGRQLSISERQTVRMAQIISRGNIAIRQQTIRRPMPNGNTVTSVAGVRASEVEGVNLGFLSWMTNSGSSNNLQQFQDFLTNLYANGDYAVILKVLDMYSQNNTLTSELTLIKGMAQFGFGMYEEALATLSEVPQTDALAEQLGYYKGLSQYNLGQVNAAIETLNRFATRYEESAFIAEVHLYLGYAYDEAGNETAAQEHFQLAYDLTDNDATRELADTALNG